MSFPILAVALLALTAPDIPVKTLRSLQSDMSRAGAQPGVYAVAMWIDPDGTMYDCEGTIAAGQKDGVETICGSLERNTAEAARDADGSPAFGRMQAEIKYILPDAFGRALAAAPRSPNLSLTVNTLPEQWAPTAQIEVVMKVGVDGTVELCQGYKQAPEELADAACAFLADSTMDRGTDRNGNPVSYIQSLLVSLSTDQTD